MKSSLAIAVIVLFSTLTAAFAKDSDIRLNSLGYQPKAPKKATIISKCTEFTINNIEDGRKIMDELFKREKDILPKKWYKK